jgi:hypothetical protein
MTLAQLLKPGSCASCEHAMSFRVQAAPAASIASHLAFSAEERRSHCTQPSSQRLQ